MSRRFYFFFVLIISISLASRVVTSAQEILPEGLPRFQHFDPEQYGGGNDNEMVYQGENGVIYVANSEGLLIYDNLSWRKLVLPNKTRVRSIASKENVIYIGGQGEFGYLSSDSLNRPVYISLSDSIKQSERFIADIWDILPIGNQLIFLSNKQLFIFKDDVFQKTIPSESFFRHGFYLDDDLFIQEHKKGIYKWTNGELHLLETNPIFEKEGVTFVEPLNENQWLIGMAYSGLYIGDFQNLEPFENNISQEIGAVKFTCGLKLPNGNVLIGTVDHGLISLQPGGNLNYVLNKKTGLHILDVLDLKTDLSGQVWVASNTGLSLIDVNGPITMIDERLGVPGAGYSSAVNAAGEYFLGTSQGLFKLNEQGGFYQAIAGSRGTAWYVQSIDDDVWVGHQSGTMRYSNEQLAHYPSDIGGWDFIKVPDEQIILEGNYSNIYVFRKNNDWQFSHRIEGIDESSRFLVMEKPNVLWMSHPYKGIYRLTLDRNYKRCNKLELFGKAHGFPSDIRLFVFKIRDQIVFTSEDGIYEYNELSNRFIPCTWLEDILGKHTSISKLAEDDKGNIWFVNQGTPGYIRFEELKTPTLVTNPFISLSGKMIPSFEHIAPFGNKVILGLQTGYALYDYSELNDSYPFPVTIRKVEQPGNPVITLDAGFDEKTDVTYHLTYSRNSLKFSFSGIDFQSGNKIVYRYQLNGYDEKWSDWSVTNSKEYTNLPEGDYSFIVEGKNIFGKVSRSSPWRFSISPPWYRTNLAIALFILVSGCALYFIVKFYIHIHLKVYKAKEAESAKEMMRLKNEYLNKEIQQNSKQLASVAFSLAQKENTIRKFRDDLESALKTPESLKERAMEIIKNANKQLDIQEEWEVFERHFDLVHNKFMSRLRERYPDLTPIQNKLCAYLRMNLSSKEIAELMNISVAGVEKNRHRLRKKLGLNLDENLKEFIFRI